MKRWMLSIAILPALAAAASAQDGGKMPWIGKGEDPVQPAYEKALRDAKPMLCFFSSEGNADCKALSSGAFSDPAVVDAASKITCIFIECGNGTKNTGMTGHLKIKKYPTLILLDPTGIPLGEVVPRDATGISGALREVATQFSGLPRFPENIDAVLQSARKPGLPVLVYFYDDSPACLAVNKSINDGEFKALREKFAFAKSPMKRGSDACTKYDVDRAPTILVLNPRLARPEEKPLARITSSRSPRELRRDLDEVLANWKAPTDVNPVPGSLPLPDPKEKLSDDEVDRKFIRARINVALDLLKREKGKEAVEVLDDVVKTFPKHVETLEAIKLLDQIRGKK